MASYSGAEAVLARFSEYVWQPVNPKGSGMQICKLYGPTPDPLSPDVARLVKVAQHRGIAATMEPGLAVRMTCAYASFDEAILIEPLPGLRRGVRTRRVHAFHEASNDHGMVWRATDLEALIQHIEGLYVPPAKPMPPIYARG